MKYSIILFGLGLPGWDEYLTPLAYRLQQLRPQADETPGLAEVLDEAEREIYICDRFGDSFGYVFYLMRRTS